MMFQLRLLKQRLEQHARLAPILRRIQVRLKTRGNQYHIHGQRNRIVVEDAMLRNVVFDIVGEDNLITLEPGCQIKGFLFRVRGTGHHLSVGRNCSFGGGSIWAEDSECVLTIGAGTTIEEAHIAVTEPGTRIEIGRGCMCAQRIVIRSGDSHSILDAASGRRLNHARDVHIGDRVWLPAGVQVLKGVSIGEDSAIGTQAVVTKSIPAGSVAVGSPARVIRSGIRWDRQRIYGDDGSQKEKLLEGTATT